MRPVPALIAVLFLGVFGRPAAAEDVIYAVPNGDWRLVLQRFEPSAIRGPDGQAVPGPVVSLRDALTMAWPGVTIQLLPGVYKQDTPEDGVLFPRNGSWDRPITLRGLGSDTVIDGFDKVNLREADEVSALDRPDFMRGSKCLQFIEKEWIVVDNLTFRKCADAAVYVRDSQYITVKNSTVMAGMYAVFAEGLRTHHLLLERNIWIQNPSGEMWHRQHWCEYKYGMRKAQAGALFGASDIPGGVVIRGNKVYHAFNGVRMYVSKALRDDSRWRGKLNTNVEVYDNEFSFIRDNVLEPEFDAANWWFHGNRIRNAHAWFSFDGLYGGRWYVYDNVGWFDDKPSRECKASGSCKQWQERNPELCGDLHDGGRVFKFRPDGRYAPGPLFVFNNSWYLRTSIIKDGRLGYIGHWNNAIDFCRPDDYPDGICDGVKPFFNGFRWDSDNYSFAFDLSNHPDFPVGLRRQGYRVSGTSAPHSQPLFVDARHGDLTLADGNLGRGAGCWIVEDDAGLISCREPIFEGIGADVGAPPDIANDRNVSFIHYDGGLYREAPRVVHVDLPAPTSGPPAVLRVVFSTPIVLMASDLRAELGYDGGSAHLFSEPCRVFGRQITCTIRGELPSAALTAITLPDAIIGANGELATMWGSVSDLVRLAR